MSRTSEHVCSPSENLANDDLNMTALNPQNKFNFTTGTASEAGKQHRGGINDRHLSGMAGRRYTWRSLRRHIVESRAWRQSTAADTPGIHGSLSRICCRRTICAPLPPCCGCGCLTLCPLALGLPLVLLLLLLLLRL